MLGMEARRIICVAILVGAIQGPIGAADCNGNGVEDALEVGIGRPGFRVQREVATGPGSEVIALGDFVHPSVLWNNGSGTFSLAPSNLKYEYTFQLDAEGMDLDGDQELIIAGQADAGRPRAGGIQIVGHDGGGGLKILATREIFAARLDAADVDGDGLPDIVAMDQGMAHRGIVVLRNGTLPPLAADGEGNGIPDACPCGRFAACE